METTQTRIDARQRQLPMALRRLERKTRHQAFLTLTHFAREFQRSKVKLCLESRLELDTDEGGLRRKEMLQRVRKALIKIQLRLGEASLQNAFL